jgi:predicted site-specific integrase-resolvase
MKNRKDWVSTKEACKILNKSPATLWRYYKKGMIKKSKATQSNFYSLQSFYDYLDRQVS